MKSANANASHLKSNALAPSRAVLEVRRRSAGAAQPGQCVRPARPSLASLAQMGGFGGMTRRAWPIGCDRAGRHCATAWAPHYLHPADATCVRKKTQELLQRWIRRKTPRESQEMKMLRMSFSGAPSRAVLAHMAVCLPTERLQTLSKSEALQSEWVALMSPTTSQTIICQVREGQEIWS